MIELLKTIWEIIFGKREEPPDVLDPDIPDTDTSDESEKGFDGTSPWIVMDVSRYQGTIDWDLVKAQNLIAGVMLKTVSTNSKFSDRKDGLYIDPTFERNYTECKRLGIPVGVYYYTYATTKDMADAELSVLKQALSGKTLELPVVVDVEENKITAIGTDELTDLTAYALKKVENMGFYAMLYTGYSFAKEHLYVGGAALGAFDVWIARYYQNLLIDNRPVHKAPQTDYPYSMWQYTSKAEVPGVNGNVDLSTTDRDYVKIIAKKGLNRLKEEA